MSRQAFNEEYPMSLICFRQDKKAGESISDTDLEPEVNARAIPADAVLSIERLREWSCGAISQKHRRNEVPVLFRKIFPMI